ncbi:MAG TPA: LysR family transcriptional regulator [Chloroflexota bacterium]
MDVADLESFILVAERGSLTVAARDLGISQPGLTRQIQKLERALGMPLFRRAPNGIHLTAAGERYRAYANDVLGRHHQMLAELRGADDVVEGELRLAASSAPAEFLAPRLVADFTALYPKVRAIVFTGDSQSVVDEVFEGRRDLGLVGARINRKGLRFDSIGGDEIVLAVPPSHPFSRLAEVPVEALGNQRFVEREDGSGTMLSVRRALARRGLSLPPYRVVMTLTTTQAIVSSVRAGYGLGFVSSLALADVGTDGPVAVRLAIGPLVRQLYLVRDGRRSPPLVGRRFAEYILSVVPTGGLATMRAGSVN